MHGVGRCACTTFEPNSNPRCANDFHTPISRARRRSQDRSKTAAVAAAAAAAALDYTITGVPGSWHKVHSKYKTPVRSLLFHYFGIVLVAVCIIPGTSCYMMQSTSGVLYILRSIYLEVRGKSSSLSLHFLASTRVYY